MHSMKQSDAFNKTILLWKVFGLWSDKSSSKIFQFYSYIIVLLTSVIYFCFYTLNLIYTPRTIEIFATQAIFYFSTFAGMAKIIMILTKRQEIISILEVMDCMEFCGNDDKTNEYVTQFRTNYTRYFNAYAWYCNFIGYVFLVTLPLLAFCFGIEEIKLPVSEYYFLTDEIRSKYFLYWYVYQLSGLVTSITINITSHTFLSGLIYMAITQCKILNWKISNIKLDATDLIENEEEKERIYLNKFHECLKHYEIILMYCGKVQGITNLLIFAQLSLAALTLCSCMCMFILPISNKDLVFMASFIIIMLLENFVPSYLGSQLTYESDNLRFAAYNYDWISRSKPFKVSLMIFVERTHRPVVITGLKMLPLSLETFASIVKTAYSFFTLVKGVQDQYNE